MEASLATVDAKYAICLQQRLTLKPNIATLLRVIRNYLVAV